mgnify:CR=1 FL=1
MYLHIFKWLGVRMKYNTQQFIQVPNFALEWLRLGLINSTEFSVYCDLISYLNTKKNGSIVWPKNQTIGERIGKKGRTITNALRTLQRCGFIEYAGHPNQQNRKIKLLVYLDSSNSRLVGKPIAQPKVGCAPF